MPASRSQPTKSHRPHDVTKLSDDQLMAQINDGHVELSLAELKARYGARILSFVRGIVRDRHLAEDVCQEVLGKIFFKSHLYRPDSNFQAWLFEIARNQALSALRSGKLVPQPVGGLSTNDDWEEGANPLESLADESVDRRLEEAEFMEAFAQALEGLPAHYRSVFELCVQQGVQYREAAKRLNVPTGTVAIRIMRARKRLYQELARHMGRVRRPPACLQ